MRQINFRTDQLVVYVRCSVEEVKNFPFDELSWSSKYRYHLAICEHEPRIRGLVFVSYGMGN